jgi:catechol 2,3-dioxygenase-like lactoylglutathione lyase family enzyme
MLLRVWDVTFAVSDLAQSVDFYGRVLELPKKFELENSTGPGTLPSARQPGEVKDTPLCARSRHEAEV